MVYDTPKKWKSMLSQAEFWYNSSFHSSLGCSPFRALYGHDPSVGAVPSKTESSTAATELVHNVKTQNLWLKEHLARAQNKMKMAADRHKTDKEFQVGDQVLLKL